MTRYEIMACWEEYARLGRHHLRGWFWWCSYRGRHYPGPRVPRGVPVKDVCYGPVWYTTSGDRRPAGSSVALCSAAPPVTGQSRTLTTHVPWVDCPACLGLLAQRAAVPVPGTGPKVVDGGPVDPGACRV